MCIEDRQISGIMQIYFVSITGTIDVEKAGNLVFSIAREDGWTVYVDGKEIPAQPVKLTKDSIISMGKTEF